MTTDSRTWIDAATAARALGVSRATLYAYVSRGLVRSQSSAGSWRERRYAREDIERLRRRAQARRDPDGAAAHALQWGMPILESSITLIDGARVYYRGRDAVDLARGHPVEEVAALIWTGRVEQRPRGATDDRSTVVERGAGRLPFVPRAQALLAAASAGDPVRFDLRPDAVARAGWRILALLARAAGSPARAAPLDARLARAWRVSGRGTDLLRRALILCADHELNVSSFTARCVASAGSSPYAVVIAGLAALEGSRHGGVSARVEAWLTGMRRARSLPGAVAARLARGEPIDGFGHPLYPTGDPRAAALLDSLREAYPRAADLRYVLDVADAVSSVTGDRPTIDFALAAMARVLRLPAGAPLTTFAIGRTIGWIGQAIEQYASGQLIRPRARYVGPAPVAGA